MRAQVEKKMAQKEKEKKEEKLRELAQMARDRRAGIKSHGDKGEPSSACLSKSLHFTTFCTVSFCHHISTAALTSRVSQLNSSSPLPPSRSSTPPIPVRLHPSRAAGGGGGDDSDVRERDEIRHDRRKERQHDRNISRAAPDKRCWTRNFKHAACKKKKTRPLFHPSACAHTHTLDKQDKHTLLADASLVRRQDAADCSGGVHARCVCGHFGDVSRQNRGSPEELRCRGGRIPITTRPVKPRYL